MGSLCPFLLLSMSQTLLLSFDLDFLYTALSSNGDSGCLKYRRKVQKAALRMKMLLLRYSTAFICAVFIITGAVSGEDKAVGQTVSFRPDKIVPPVSSIIWKHRSSTGSVVKAIEWDVDDGDNIPNPRFKGITTLDRKTGQITITNLIIEHSGVYTIDINSKEQEQRFTLTVMERVPKPKMTIEVSSNPDVAYLRCAYNEMIIWKNSSGETLNGTKNHDPGEYIMVKNTRNPENFYTCTLKNAVSEEISDPVTEREIFGTGSNAGMIVAIVIVVFIVIAVIAIVLSYLIMKTVHESVNNICPCIPNIFGPLDCLLKKTDREPKNSAPNDVASPLNETAP
uniref:Si:ch211-132g1.3 n=1 Tax=Cyprinus carpio carpio TaxID=630221 RepID=A0A9J7Y2E0_CYPCA